MNSVDKSEAGLTRLERWRSVAVTADGWDGTLKPKSAQLAWLQQSFLEPLLRCRGRNCETGSPV